ncbi:asparagine synthase-related protein [Coprobacillaceae bacterium CR2/5/TPMF4]|nr:asparagine synthase-related protein [Coprobacillaceae bacterium CR2/5/TPMF4]
MYDVLRADRCISAHALEGRVPFADIDFVDYAMSIDPAKKMNTYNKGKYLLRKAFKDQGYLPDEILFREKAAFSDAVGHSMVDYLKEYAESIYSDDDVIAAKRNILLQHHLQKNLCYIVTFLNLFILIKLNG